MRELLKMNHLADQEVEKRLFAMPKRG